MANLILTFVVVLCFLATVISFNSGPSTVSRNVARKIKMEYIPDGISKEKWAALKKKEAEDAKTDKSAVGITKFKSRSFEAFQKGGGKNLFSDFGPDTPMNERPYMRRGNGAVDGEDLKKKGLFGMGQGKEIAKSAEDLKYEQLEKEGKLRSTQFKMPWNNDESDAKFAKANADRAAAKLEKAKGKPLASSKKAAPLKKGVAAPVEAVAEPPKKKFFGLF